MKNIKIVLVSAIAATLMFSGCGKPENVVNVYNWGDYIDPDTIEMFEEETGYKVNYDMFETCEDMYTKIVNAKTSYDVLIPSDYMIERLINEDMLEKINFDNIPNYKYIDDDFKNLSFDPNNEYSVPYTWGTMGILYNSTMVDEEIDSWKSLWDEKYANNIMMYNSQRDTIGITLKMLGYSLNSTDEKELAEATDALIKQSDIVLCYVVDEGKDKMIQGEAALTLAWSGDAQYCIDNNPDLRYVIPKEGSNIFFDSMIIPKTTQNKEGAEAFINFMSRPDISAKNAAYIGYSTPESAAREKMGDAGKSEVAYPDLSKHTELEIFTTLGDKIKIYDELWTKVISSF